VEKAYFY